MYQTCTNTTVNTGEQRGATVSWKRPVSSPITALPGTAEVFGPGLITRRSWVQIPPPPPNKTSSEALSAPVGRASDVAVVNICQRFSTLVVNMGGLWAELLCAFLQVSGVCPCGNLAHVGVRTRRSRGPLSPTLNRRAIDRC